MARRLSEPTFIAGELIPANTVVSVSQWAAWYVKAKFSRPEEFIPERWLDEDEDKAFDNDAKSGFHPFSVGIRNCIGKNLAYLEMRLVLARLLWNFDFELADPDFAWTNKEAFIVWEKLPLMVRIRPVEH